MRPAMSAVTMKLRQREIMKDAMPNFRTLAVSNWPDVPRCDIWYSPTQEEAATLSVKIRQSGKCGTCTPNEIKSSKVGMTTIYQFRSHTSQQR